MDLQDHGKPSGDEPQVGSACGGNRVQPGPPGAREDHKGLEFRVEGLGLSLRSRDPSMKESTLKKKATT